MTSKKGREIHLKKRPVGLPVDDDFKLVEVDVSEGRHGGISISGKHDVNYIDIRLYI